MADNRISAPQNFQASKASAAPGDSITFTWNGSTAQSGVTIEYYQLTGFNPVTGQYVGQDYMPNNTRIPATSRSYTCTYPDNATTYILYFVTPLGTDNATSAGVTGLSSTQIQIYVSNEPANPPAPKSITVGDYFKGQSVFISWTPVSFSEGIKYVLQYSHNGGTWTNVYDGSNTSYTYSPATSVTSVQYRVRAQVTSDSTRYSEWTVSETKTAQTQTVTQNSAAYVGVGTIARKVKGIYVGVEGKAKKVKKGYIGVNGVARLFYSSFPVWSADWKDFYLPSAANWYDVTYGNGKFIAVNLDSNISAYSTDGSNWNSVTLPSQNGYFHITYGNGKFVAISPPTTVAYSTDGSNWKYTTIPQTGRFEGVFYGNGKFIALPSNENIFAYSTDGINWNTSTISVPSGSSLNWYGATYGNGKFIALPSNENIFAYSTDGINWNTSTLPVSIEPLTAWYGATYGNGKFVAVNLYSNVVVYSTDGINWNSTTISFFSNGCNDVTYGNGKFLALPSNYSKVAAYSTDGINWYPTTLSRSGYWNSAIYGNGKFIAISNYYNYGSYTTG